MRELELDHLGKLHRKNYYAEGTFNHPAKMHPELVRWIINEYTNFGDCIMDPMAGIGTTLIEGAMLGRYCYGIEIERRWAELIMESSKKMTQGVGFPTGKLWVILGNAQASRTFNDVPPIRACITSPPYGIELSGGGIAKEQRPGGLRPYDKNNRDRNLGNHLLHTPEYQIGMRNVYINCHDKVVRDGYLITVTKNFYRDGDLQRLDQETIRLAEEARWEFEEQIKFKLPYLSMWQKMNMDRFPDREIIEHEDILVFRK